MGVTIFLGARFVYLWRSARWGVWRNRVSCFADGSTETESYGCCIIQPEFLKRVLEFIFCGAGRRDIYDIQRKSSCGV